jgi:hypothetical protein
MGYFNATDRPGTAQHLAEKCKDDTCPRLPCRMWKAGYRKGWDDGYWQGFREGEAVGFASGFAAGMAAGMAASAGSG